MVDPNQSLPYRRTARDQMQWDNQAIQLQQLSDQIVNALQAIVAAQVQICLNTILANANLNLTSQGQLFNQGLAQTQGFGQYGQGNAGSFQGGTQQRAV